MTQGNPLLLALFNLMVDAIICKWNQQVIEKEMGIDNGRHEVPA